MDLTQKKLTKAEWKNVEVSVSDNEKPILKMIIDGYKDLNMRRNDNQSMLKTMKLENTIKGVHEYLFQEYFEKTIAELLVKYPGILTDEVVSEKKSKDSDKKSKKSKKHQLKTGELIRINSIDKRMDNHRENIFEYTLMNFCCEILKSIHSRNDKYAFYLYTILQMKKSSIPDVNPYVMQFVDRVIRNTIHTLNMNDVLTQSYEFIEKNPHLMKYEDKTLFEHQKQIFSAFHYDEESSPTKLEAMSKIPPKLVLYTAPTGTGKTLTPLGLSQGHRIIFICAARHVGLALAKAAVSMNKRIAIAFGCDTPDDIRLHYYSASVYTTHRRSGGIGRVDNSVGDKVEIMICDVQSYLIAMRYMIAFSPYCESPGVAPDVDLITYWDEPTISMDYDDHPLHKTINNVWCKNIVSKMVLSCATLPHEDEIGDALSNYRSRFQNAVVETISSYDCRKSIAVLNSDGMSVVPHLLYSDYSDLQICVEHCIKNKTMLRYFDLVEVTRFLLKVSQTINAIDERYHMSNYFSEGITSITMNSLKLYYLCVLQNLDPDSWNEIHSTLSSEQNAKFETKSLRKSNSVESRYSYQPPNAGEPISRSRSVMNIATKPVALPSGVSVTTTDAYTMTDGPSIFLADDVEKVGKFYIKTSRIPERVYKSISVNIGRNNIVQRELTDIENKLEDIASARENAASTSDTGLKSSLKGGKKKSDHKDNRDENVFQDTKLSRTAENLRSRIVSVNLERVYIPNTNEHQNVWAPDGKVVKNAFVPNISDDEVCEIMALDVDNDKKMLLLLGIGMFVDESTANPRYMEVMKRLATDQQLFMILASSDYIYGTNYQFCHGFIGKDLKSMTQQKTIQAMGRIGRNQMQQEYTIRFRDNDMLHQLFKPSTDNKEAIVMSRLFQ